MNSIKIGADRRQKNIIFFHPFIKTHIFAFSMCNQMKKYYKIHIFIISLLLFSILHNSCSDKKAEIQSILEQAEKIMHDRPDSALILLSKVENPKSLNEPLYYEYITLWVQAKNKNQKDITEDITIQDAANFFLEKTDNHQKAANALFYWGRLNLYKKQYKTAINEYLKAEELARKENDYYLLGLINTDIASIHSNQFNYDKCLNRYYQAKDCFSKIGKHNWEYNTLNHIGNIYLFTEPKQIDKAITSYNQALEGAIQIKDSSLITICLNNLAAAYSENNDYENAKKHILQSISLRKEDDHALKSHIVLSEIYIETNQIDSAIAILNSLSEREDEMDKYEQYDYYDKLYNINIRKNDYKSALDYHEKMMDIYIQVTDENNKESIQEIEARYNNERLENLYNQTMIKKQRTELLLSVITLITLIIAIIMSALYRNNKNRRKITEEKIEAMESLAESEKKISGHMQQEANRANELLRQKLTEELDIIKKVAYIHSISQNEAKRLKEYEKLFSKRTESILKWDSIYKLIDELYPGFRARLEEKMPQFSEKDKQMCYLIKTRFSMTEIAYILGYNQDSATSMKYKLRKKAGFDSAPEFSQFLDTL